jgi:hypothetical protein
MRSEGIQQLFAKREMISPNGPAGQFQAQALRALRIRKARKEPDIYPKALIAVEAAKWITAEAHPQELERGLFVRAAELGTTALVALISRNSHAANI